MQLANQQISFLYQVALTLAYLMLILIPTCTIRLDMLVVHFNYNVNTPDQKYCASWILPLYGGTSY